MLDPENPELRHKFASVPKSNTYAESVFGLLDHIVRQKPNITTLASEAYVMFSQNKTMAWINVKTEQEQVSLLKEARISTEELRKV